MPPFPVPLPWWRELRGEATCSWLALEVLLAGLERAASSETLELIQTNWDLADWRTCTQDQLVRAIRLLGGVGQCEEPDSVQRLCLIFETWL